MRKKLSEALALVDFETKSIADYPRPSSPPPAGLAIRLPGKDYLYLAWGHPTGTNGAWALRKGKMVDVAKSYPDPKRAATEMLRDAYKIGVLGHNVAKFDLPVAEDHLGLKPPPWSRVEDTLFTLFLKNPHAASFHLKDSAERDLGEKPEERDAVFEWLADHGLTSRHVEKGKIKYGSKENPAAAHISKAPGQLVGLYAIGDLTRTAGLYDLHQPWVIEQGMQGAYDVERELAPVLLENERTGIRVDMDALERDIPVLTKALARSEEWIRKRLKIKDKDFYIAATKERRFNFDSDAHIAQALRAAGVVKSFPKTATGKDSVSKKVLRCKLFSDPKVYCAIHYRNTMATVLTQSLQKWFAEGSKKGGKIFRDWRQVKSGSGGDMQGAASGRVTVSGLANIAKRFGGKDPDYKHPDFMDVPEPPLARSYILPDEGEEFGHCDYDQQEMKLTAHYEDGTLAEKYREDPKMDAHEFVHDTVLEMSGEDYNRDVIKTVGFRKLYGGGIAGLAEQLDIPYETAKEIIQAWEAALPDVVELDRELRERFKEGQALRTIGGRVYYCKPPAVAKRGVRKGVLINFFYTALNYLIQPSAADQTKRALLAYHKHPKRKGRLLCTVYDEINISMPSRKELDVLDSCMCNAVKLDVPVTTTRKAGPCWGKLEKITTTKKSKEAA